MAKTLDQWASKRRSLHHRVVVAFGLFALALSVLFALAVWGALHLAEDRQIEHTLELAMDDYLRRQADDPAATFPEIHWLGTTNDPHALPESLQPYAELEDGFHEIQRLSMLLENSTEPEFSLLTRTVAPGQRLYFYLDSAQLEALGGSMAFMGLCLLLVIAVVTTLGVLLGRATAQRVIAPVIELADRVRQRDVLGHHGTSTPTELSQGLGDDEVGLLARALDASAARSRAFLEREKRFTRDASHELRSPVTIVRGAVELLSSRPEAEEPGIQRPLARIQRAADDMSNLIEAFLWLAREEALSESQEPRSLALEVEAVVERYRHLLDGKDVDLKIDIDPSQTVDAPQGILGIVLGNLVANAFFYTPRGRVDLGGSADRFEVIDSGPGIPEDRRRDIFEAHQRGVDSQGAGLGLTICRDLCRRFGWRLELSSVAGPRSGTRASIDFSPS